MNRNDNENQNLIAVGTVRNPLPEACLTGRLHINTQKLHIERGWGIFVFSLWEKKKIKRGNKNKLNHIPICTKQIMLSKPFEYKIIHYSTTLSIQSPELKPGGIEQGGGIVGL